MEMINIPREKFESIMAELARLRYLKQIDFDLVNQFKDSLEDLKTGRFKIVA